MFLIFFIDLDMQTGVEMKILKRVLDSTYSREEGGK